MLPTIGAACFGLVIGWITYRTLRRKENSTALSDISTVIAAVGGGAVMVLFKDANLFAGYAIGLAVGFFGYFIVALLVTSKDKVNTFMGN